ncbi:MAG: NADH:ubiquinone reductase (Na(+)-transporting) subunit B [Desulfobacterales bacterium]|nr:NADH:ubiquinone reductase (Na(+)-transporting) subunit B [Desulfobacterales bacterium]
MNPIKKWLNASEKHFTGKGKLAALEPLFDATKTFFFLPSPKISIFPFVRDCLDVKRYMSFVILALLPCLFFGMYNTGYQAGLAIGESYTFMQSFLLGARYVIPIIIVTYAVGFFWETLFASIRGHQISEGLLVSGLLFPLILPANIPLWQVALGISFGIVIGKEIFGGTGRNLLNPALTGRAFLFFSYPASTSGDIWVVNASVADGISGATALSVMSTDGQTISAALSDSGFTLTNLFLGLVPGSVGETSALLCLLGAVFLMITRIANYRIIIGGIIGLVVTAVFFSLLPGGGNSWADAGPLYHLCAGGFLFGITFMATDPVSAPGTDPARWVYGFLIGFLTVTIRVANPAFMEGIMLAILFMNIIAPLLDHIVLKRTASKRIPNV